jgi:nicotinamidase-related amidase
MSDPRTLVIIDIQNDYFDDGAYPLVGSAQAAERAAVVLAGFRERGERVVHVQHLWDEPEATFMRPGTRGVEIHDIVRPLSGEPVVTKSEPNAMLSDEFVETLEANGSKDLVVMGMMTSMCVDSTVRTAADLGYRVQLVHDACAAPDLEFGGQTVPGAAVHAAFIAALGDSFAQICSSDEVAREA